MEAGQVQWQMGAVALDEVIACGVDATHLLAEEEIADSDKSHRICHRYGGSGSVGAGCDQFAF